MQHPAPAEPAATILLVRDSASGPEVFMVVRHHQIDFASGALVFPGGRVDPVDHALAADPAICPDPRSDTHFRIAAIRETFEECGVLLAKPVGSDSVICGEHLREVERTYRDDLNAGRVGFDTILRETQLRLAPEALVHYAHWVTPSHQRKRYDTQFYLTEAPATYLAIHDGQEAVESIWIRPRDALAGAENGRYKLVFATLKNLEKLAKRSCVADALAMARASMVVTVQPKATKIDETRRKLVIPIEAGYGGPEFIVDTPPAS